MKHGCYSFAVLLSILNPSNLQPLPESTPPVDSPQLIDSFSYFSMIDITVTDVGSNSGVLGRSGSGGLGGAAAGLGSSFFFGAIVDGSQETKGGTTGEGDQANC